MAWTLANRRNLQHYFTTGFASKYLLLNALLIVFIPPSACKYSNQDPTKYANDRGHNQIVYKNNEHPSRRLVKSDLIIGTLTTTLSRMQTVNGSFGLCLKNLIGMELLDRIYVNVPWAYGVRRKEDNFSIPNELITLSESSSGKLRILRCDDYGPSTKLLPILRLPPSEIPPSTMIITFDDDRLYTIDAIRALVEFGRKFPTYAITIAAWPISILSAHGKRGKPGGPIFSSSITSHRAGIQYVREGPVDLVLGFYGVLYRASFFQNYSDIFNYTRNPVFVTSCAWVDDIWFSGHLERLRITKYTIGNVEKTRSGITDLSNVEALSLDHGESVKQNHDNVLCAQALRHEYGVWRKSNSLQ